MYVLKNQTYLASIEMCKRVENFLKKNKIKYSKEHKKDAKAVIVIGDDNLILNTFREIKETPVLGIRSSQGFLAQADEGNYQY